MQNICNISAKSVTFSLCPFTATYWYEDGRVGKQERSSSPQRFLPQSLGEPVPHPVPRIRPEQIQTKTRQALIKAAASWQSRGEAHLPQATSSLILQALDYFHGHPAREATKNARPPGQRWTEEGQHQQAGALHHQMGQHPLPRPWPSFGCPPEGVVPQSLPLQDRIPLAFWATEYYRGPAPSTPPGAEHLPLDRGGHASGWGAGAWTLLTIALCTGTT